MQRTCTALLWILVVTSGAAAAETAHTGVAYQLAIRPAEEGEIAGQSAGRPPAAVITTQYTAEDGKVRVGASLKAAYLFKDGVMYVIDIPSRTVHVLEHATLQQVREHYADAVRQAQSAAAAAQADQRAAAQAKAADLQRVSERLLQPVTRDYRVTVRFETVDGHACRVWEETEGGAKRLELCVAPTHSIPGGAQILAALKTLSRFRQGSDFALGVSFGLADWWPDVATLGGVPLLIREYKYEAMVAEIMLSGMRPLPIQGDEFDLPADYAVQTGPDYTQWYVR